jgi:hypothetical protein
MKQEEVSRGFVNEKFSFSLAIIVSLVLGALTLFHYLKTNTTYLKLQSDYLGNEGVEILLWVFFIVIIPTLIVTLILIAFFFSLQIIFRGTWFYVNDYVENSHYKVAANRMDKLAQFFYGLSFTLLILVSTVILYMILSSFYFAFFFSILPEYIGTGHIYGLGLTISIMDIVFLTFILILFKRLMYHEKHAHAGYRKKFRAIFIIVYIGFAITGFVFLISLLVFLDIQYPFFYPMMNFYWIGTALLIFLFWLMSILLLCVILPYIVRMTGIFCLFHRLTPPASPIFKILRRLRIAGLAVMVIDIPIDAHEEDISRQRYFYTVNPVASTHNEEGFVTVIARHIKAGLFGKVPYVNSKAHFRVLNTAKSSNIQ